VSSIVPREGIAGQLVSRGTVLRLGARRFGPAGGGGIMLPGARDSNPGALSASL